MSESGTPHPAPVVGTDETVAEAREDRDKAELKSLGYSTSEVNEIAKAARAATTQNARDEIYRQALAAKR